MIQQNINYGAYPDDLNADAIRTAFQKIQQNFTVLFDKGSLITGVSEVIASSGLTQNRTTDRVILKANIANITVSSNTLKVGINGNTTTTGLITKSSDFLILDLPDNINTQTLTASNVISPQISAGNLTANSANISSANIVTLNATSVNSSGNITADRFISTNTTAPPFIVSSSAMVANLRSEFAISANSALIANIANSALVANTVTNANQPNIKTVGTLTTLTVAGPVNLGTPANITIEGGSNNQFLTSSGGTLLWKAVPIDAGTF